MCRSFNHLDQGFLHGGDVDIFVSEDLTQVLGRRQDQLGGIKVVTLLDERQRQVKIQQREMYAVASLISLLKLDGLAEKLNCLSVVASVDAQVTLVD